MPLLEVNLNPDKRTLRLFGYIACLGFSLIGGLVYWRGGLFGLTFGEAASPIPWALWAAGLAAAALATLAPRANRPLYVVLVVVTYPVGWLLSFLFMAAVFYGLITPIGLLFRLLGRDALGRHFEPKAPTYWLPHRPPEKTERYFRQF